MVGLHKTYTTLLRQIQDLADFLPLTVPLGKPNSLLVRALSSTEHNGDEDGPWKTFNGAMDSVFGSDCVTADGILVNIFRGEFGMDRVIAFCQAFAVYKEHEFDYGLAVLKLERLVASLRVLT